MVASPIATQLNSAANGNSSAIDQPRWASTVVIRLEASGHGTVLRHREQYALLHYSEEGARDAAHLKGGVSLGLTGLAHAIDASIELPPAS